MKKLIILLIGLSLWVEPALASVSRTGFVSENVWFSSESIAIGDSVTIYTAVFNNSDEILGGNVTFLDGDRVLGTKTFSIPENSVRDVRIDWIATSGNHEISAHLATNDPSIVLGTKETIPSRVNIIDPTVEEKNDLPESATRVLDSVDNLQDKVVENIPTGVTDRITAAFSDIEEFRSTQATAIQEKVDAKKTETESADTSEGVVEEITFNTNTNELAVKTNPLQTPFTYISLFFYKIL